MLLRDGDPAGSAYLDAWADSDVPILRRLALHGWAYRADRDATDKIVWLRQRGYLYRHELHHEVFQLIEAALPSAASEVADALVADVLAGPDDANDDERRAYTQFNTLTWIVRNAPALQSARRALEHVRAQNPHFAEHEHLDFLSWFSSGSVHPQPPMTAEAFHALIKADAAGAVGELRRFEGIGPPSNGPTWNDALALLSETVRDHPSDGFAIHNAVGSGSVEIMRGVISGWSTATLDAQTADEILQRLATMDLHAIAADLIQFLADGGRSESNPTEWHTFAAARRLAADVWSELDAHALADDVDDWLQRAINDPAGRLAQFWMNAIAADWKAAGDKWTGLPEEMQTQLETMLASGDHCAAMTEVIFASQALFFFRADRDWCTAHVLPLFDWTNLPRARRAWDGYLIWGRWNDQLLSAGLLDGYLATTPHLDLLRKELREQLCSHLAGVAMTSDLDALGWIQKFTSVVDVTLRVEWMNQVSWLLDQLPAEAVEHQWRRWMREYWQERLGSVPRQMTEEEASAMAAWTVYLTDSIGEAVTLATSHQAGFVEHTDILSDLEGNQLQHAPHEYARLIAHLMRHTTPPFWGGCHALAKIIPALRNQVDALDVTAIIQEAVRLGCADAPQW